MATEPKNIKRNSTRPKSSKTPYVQGRGHGKSKEKEEYEAALKLDSWKKL